MNALKTVIDFILPPRCIVTGDIVDNQGMLSPKAWTALTFISDPQCQKCGVPFEFDVGNSLSTCVKCLDKPPTYHQARSALVYDDASRDLVLAFKHGDKTHYITGFLPWLKRAGQDLIKVSDIVMPVPLHQVRLIQRRYNQAGIIAKYLAKDCDKTLMLDGLERVRSTPPQGFMNATERQKNVRRAFAVRLKHRMAIQGRTILLIDDVLTTGATIEECTQTLMAAGAKAVNVLTLTRTIRK